MLDLLDLTEPAYRAGYLARTPASAQPSGTRCGPRFSIVMPLYAPDLAYLRHAVASVLQQTYGLWQLVLVDDANHSAPLQAYCNEVAASDPRVLFVQAAQHGHICRTTNLGLQHAQGDYVTFVDQDDALAPTALAQVAACVQANPKLQLIYSDEDRIDPFGARFLPYFKPAWSPDLLRAQNYVCHLAVYRRSLVEQVGGLRVGLEGSQDHDLALRASAQLGRDEIAHLPQILYHWRTLPQSTATHGAAAKPYALAAGQRAVGDALRAAGSRAEVAVARGFYRVQWPVPRPAARLEIVLHNLAPARAAAAQAAWRKAMGPSGLPCTITAVPAATEARLGAQASNQALNAAVAASRADVVVLVDGHARIAHGDCLLGLVGLLQRPEVGFVTGRCLAADGTVAALGLVLDPATIYRPSHAGCPANADGYFGRACLCHNVSAVSRLFCATRADHWRHLGGLDTSLPPAFADVDLCLRSAAQGRLHVAEPQASCQLLAPLLPQLWGSHETADQVAHMQTRWHAQLQDDPFTSPHLDVLPTSHTLRQPAANVAWGAYR